jgi:hypothetical protein
MIVTSSHDSRDALKAARPGWDCIMLVLLLAFPSTGFIQKYTGLAGVAGYVAWVALVVFGTRKLATRMGPWLRRYFCGLSALALVGLAVCFALVYPLENGKGPGKSSDRDDGLNLAVVRMAEGQSPYYKPAEFPGPLSIFPGGVVLAAPFVALGNSAYQNLFWLAVFLCTTSWLFKDRALALILLIVPLALSPAAQYEYISGGDMLANGIYVAVFFLLALRWWSKPDAPVWQRCLACVLLGLGLASRANFPLLLPLFGAVLWRRVGLRQALDAVGLVALVAAVITVPFYLNDPAGFTPLLTRYKLAVIDDVMPWASKAIIGMTALLGMIGGLVLSRHTAGDLNQAFFRWCTLVTLCPMVCAVALASCVGGHLDFGFMRDRFGLMYVVFALLGWGGKMLGENNNDIQTYNQLDQPLAPGIAK